MTVYDEFILDAIEEIEYWTPSGNNAIWVKKGSPAVIDDGAPWNTQPAVEVEHDVRILFLPDDLEDRQLYKYLRKTEVAEGQVNGWMYHYDAFDPLLNDVVRRPLEHDPENFEELVVRAIDPLRPENQTVIYFFEFGR